MFKLCLPQRYGCTIRLYSDIVPRRVFESGTWLVQKPSLNNLPKNEVTKNIKKFDFSLDLIPSNSIYIKNQSFKLRLDKAMQYVYNSKVTSFVEADLEMKHYAWLKLRDYIYYQLKNSNTEDELKKYNCLLSQIINPTEPSSILYQLYSINKFSKETWNSIVPNCKKPPTDFDIYVYLLSMNYNFIYGQEILTRMIPSYGTVNKSNKKLDISNPAEWFPEARKMKRNIIMHLGPTNSGKTYKALQKLKSVDHGYYAGPLRLLAREVYDKFKSEGIRCNLLTGEEVIPDLNEIGTPAGLTSGTVEMIPLNRTFNVVVLDEIQMMTDTDRGWAWTNAVLGVRANELHLCGEKSILPIIKKIVESTGDNLVVNEYERLGNLEVETKCINNGMKGLRKGDCIVAFSKKKILDLKLKIESETDFKVAVIYGSLPPETRLQQAILFNSGDYDVLVASDAIGMGLNLSIDRVIFTTDLKFNGKELIELTSSNIKQIGGRAGRFKSNSIGSSTSGYVTSFDRNVLKSVKMGMNAPIEYLSSAVIWPTDEICAKIMANSPSTTSLSELLSKIANELEQTSNKLYKLSDLRNKLNVIETFQTMDDIPFYEKLRLSNAPVKDMPLVKKAFSQFCDTIAKRNTRSLLSYQLPFEVLDYGCITDEKFDLEIYESLYNIVTLYFWLGNRYPNYFIDLESAQHLKIFCELIIFEKLDKLKKNPYGKRTQLTVGTFYKKRASLLNKRS